MGKRGQRDERRRRGKEGGREEGGVEMWGRTL